jgi:hypothetical protein
MAKTAPAAVGETVETTVLVALEDLAVRLARDIELRADHCY